MSTRDDLLAAIETLTDDQAKTILGWLGVLEKRDQDFAGEQSVGALGDALGMVTVAREPGKSRMWLDVDPKWHNPIGVLHGGVIYTIVDYSMGAAVLPNLPDGEFCSTIEAKINYLAAVREGTLTVETEVVKQGRNIAFTESKVRDDNERLVATGSGSMFIFTSR